MTVQDRVCVGAVAGAFGVRGEVRLKPFTADPENIAAYGPVETEDGTRRFTITLNRGVKGGVAGRLSGVQSREEAEALRGQRLYVPRSALPALEDEDEFYHSDLIGLTVEDLRGETLGVVLAVLNHGAGDMLEVKSQGRPSILLPFTRDAVPHVDMAGRKVIADPPAGLFDDDDAEAADDET